MTVQEFENKVWQMDRVRVIVRAPAGKQVKDYKHKNAAQGNWRITEYIDKRLKPLIDDLEVMILEGDGEQPHGGSLLDSVRQSYKR